MIYYCVPLSYTLVKFITIPNVYNFPFSTSTYILYNGAGA